MVPGSEKLSLKYKGFSQLMTSLDELISNDLVSHGIQRDLDEAKAELREARRNYLQVEAIYSCMNEILLENNYGFKDTMFEDNANLAKNPFQRLAEETSLASGRHCLNLSLSNHSPEPSLNLFGLTHEDLLLDNRAGKEMIQDLQQTFVPLIEEKLQRKSLKVYKYWYPSSQDSEGLMLAKANQLVTVIQKERDKLERLKRKLSEEGQKMETLHYTSHTKLHSSLEQLEKTIEDADSMQVKDLTSVTSVWLETRCDFILAKIKVMKNHLFKETYTKENLEALKKIRYHLEEEIAKTKKELKQTRYSISSYEAIGDTFKQLLSDYAQLTSQIDNKKWALHELQSSK